MVVGTGFILVTNLAVNNYVHLANRDRQLTLANSFAEGEVESLRNSGFNAINTGTTDLSGQLPSDMESPKSASLNVTYQGGNPDSGVKQIDITVNYTDQVARSYSYTTYIGELGVGQ